MTPSATSALWRDWFVVAVALVLAAALPADGTPGNLLTFAAGAGCGIAGPRLMDAWVLWPLGFGAARPASREEPMTPRAAAPSSKRVYDTFRAAEEAVLGFGRHTRPRPVVRACAGVPADHGYSRALGFPVGQLRDYRKRGPGGLEFHLQEYELHFELHLDWSATRQPLRHAWDVLLSWRRIAELRARRHDGAPL